MAKPKNDPNAKPGDEPEVPEVPEVPDTSDHVEMRKHGHENIHVHPDTVDEHVKLGWKQA